MTILLIILGYLVANVGISIGISKVISWGSGPASPPSRPFVPQPRTVDAQRTRHVDTDRADAA